MSLKTKRKNVVISLNLESSLILTLSCMMRKRKESTWAKTAWSFLSLATSQQQSFLPCTQETEKNFKVAKPANKEKIRLRRQIRRPLWTEFNGYQRQWFLTSRTLCKASARRTSCFQKTSRTWLILSTRTSSCVSRDWRKMSTIESKELAAFMASCNEVSTTTYSTQFQTTPSRLPSQSEISTPMSYWSWPNAFAGWEMNTWNLSQTKESVA